MAQRFTEKQILGFLKLQEKGATIAEICEKEGVSEQTFYRWKNKYATRENETACNPKEMKELASENKRLMQTVGELYLDNKSLQMTIAEKA